MLESLGLSKYEEQVFLTLLEYGALQAKQVSKISKVPTGRVYDVLKSLESRGILMKNSERPQKFIAVEPRQAIEILKEAKQKEYDQIIKSADSYLPELEKKYNRIDSDDIQWRVAVGEDIIGNFLMHMKESRFQYNGYLDLTKSHLDLIQNYADEFVAIFKRMMRDNIKVRMLIGVKEQINLAEIPQFAELLNKIDVRFTDVQSYPFSIIDNEKCLLKMKNPANPDEDLALLYFVKKSLAIQLQEQFDNIWSSAKKPEIQMLIS